MSCPSVSRYCATGVAVVRCYTCILLTVTTDLANGEDRRELIARSAITVIARDGVRALTHRAVDREAGIPQGATSHHARTRQALITLVIDTLESRTLADGAAFIESLTGQDPGDIDGLARKLATLVDALTSRRADMRARYALMLEPADDPSTHTRLAVSPEIDDLAVGAVSQALATAGLDGSVERVRDLMALTDALIFSRTVVGTAVDALGIFVAYLHGSPRATRSQD